ncbi:glutathione S-transferase family protein [bacterium]|nr:glutathione S-transferase family protein [bacterium]
MPGLPPSGGLHPEITLPHEAEWELYHNSFSLCSKKVRVCLAELGLAYRSRPIHLIETGAYENVSRAFLAINPAGTVPVLVHQGHPVYESHEQISYAARHGARGGELLATDPDTRALVERWVDCASLVGDATTGTDRRAGHCVPGLTFPLFATMVRHIPYREIARGLLTHPNKERPLFFGLLKLRTVRGLPRIRPAMRLLRRSRDDMGGHLDALGRHLEAQRGPWIAGDRFTLADVSWVVILDRLAEADWAEHFWGNGRRPTIAAYWERLRARPSFTAAIDAVRSPVTLRGIADLAAAKRDDPALRTALEGVAPATPADAQERGSWP